MSQILHDNADTKAIAISWVFSENSRAKNPAIISFYQFIISSRDLGLTGMFVKTGLGGTIFDISL